MGTGRVGLAGGLIELLSELVPERPRIRLVQMPQGWWIAPAMVLGLIFWITVIVMVLRLF